METRLAVVVAVALLVSCGGDGDGGDGDGTGDAAPATTAAPTTTTSSSTTTTPEPPDPFTVPEDPADIDEDYVEAVINEHNRVIGDALRIQLEGGDVQEIIDRYNAIYVPEVADDLLTSVLSVDDETIASLQVPPGNQFSRVLSVEAATPDCITARVMQDSSAVVRNPPPAAESVVKLRANASNASDENGTSWQSEGHVLAEDGSDIAC